MKHWKPTQFKPEWPLPEDGCAFVLGGSLHGEIVQGDPLQPYVRVPVMLPFKHSLEAREIPSVQDLSARFETYRLERFCAGKDGRTLWFYILDGEATDQLLIQSFTQLCMFLREARKEPY